VYRWFHYDLVLSLMPKVALSVGTLWATDIDKRKRAEAELEKASKKSSG